VWPKWLIESMGDGAATSTTEYWNSKTAETKRWSGRVVVTRRLCQACNNGWMSNIEAGARPTMGGLVNDLSLRLDREQQQALALWACKTAMVSEGLTQGTNSFYSDAQRRTFRSTVAPLPESAIWIGRSDEKALHGEARKLHPREAKPVAKLLDDACATVLIAGHLVFNVLSLKKKPKAAKEQIELRMVEPWTRRLSQIWPIEKERVQWPPRESFRDLDDGLRDLRNRFGVSPRVSPLGLNLMESGGTQMHEE
jgi:hypothetical protein